jgi:hypothetical protein
MHGASFKLSGGSMLWIIIAFVVYFILAGLLDQLEDKYKPPSKRKKKKK